MKYRLSFTAGSLMLNETIKVAAIYLDVKDWDKTRQKAITENIIQKNTKATAKRQLQEIVRRLINLSDDSINALATADISFAKHLTYFAVIKTYAFIFDFVNEFILTKLTRFDTVVLDSDYDRFIIEKSDLHPELELISDTTKAKIKQVLFRILAESDIIDSPKSRIILQPYIPDDIVKIIVNDNPKYLKAFLVFESDIKRYIGRYS